MLALTPSERRGAAVVVLLLAIGAGWDLWRARHPALAPAPVPWTDPAPPRASSPAAGVPIAGAPAPAGTARAAPDAPVDLNRASAAELDALPGIGPVLASRIVEHRRLHGSFRSIDELLAVRGIGPRLLERLRPHVRTGPAGSVAPPR